MNPKANSIARNFELAYGVRVSKDPLDMTNTQLIDALYDVASFASSKLTEARTLQNIVARHMERGADGR